MVAQEKVQNVKIGDRVTLTVGEMGFDRAVPSFKVSHRAKELGLDGFSEERLDREERQYGGRLTHHTLNTEFVFTRVR